MTKPRRVDSTPRAEARLPFASESGLQRFVEEHAKQLFGVDVVASTRRGGGRFLNIDILALDQSGRPWIVECKHDLVDAGAATQLDRYRAALVSGWDVLERRLATDWRGPTPQKTPDPVLVLIGYRFDRSLADDRTFRIAYRYHDVEFTNEELQKQKPGRVSLYEVNCSVAPADAHPKVCKKLATSERLERLAPALAESFWQIDSELKILKGVNVKYGGKNFVRYATRAGIFAEAVICQGAIQWHIKLTHLLDSQRDSDVGEVLKILNKAYQQAG